MKQAEYEKQRRLKNRQNATASYSVEYPEFGELIAMLFKLFADYVNSMYQGFSLAKPVDGRETAATNQSNKPADTEVDKLLRDFYPARAFTPIHTATQPSTQLPVEVVDNENTYTPNKPAKP